MAFSGPFPQLRSLYVSVLQEFNDPDDQDEDGEIRELIIGRRPTFQDAPNLSTMHITRSILPDPSVIPSSITNLSLVLPSYHLTSNLSIASVLRVLEELHSLEVFSLVLPAGQTRRFEPAEDTERLISLPYLCAIGLTGHRDMYNLLLHLVTPRLKYLHLRSPDDLGSTPDEGIGRCLLHFLMRSSPPLEELELRDADIPTSYFIQCFCRLDRLKTLRLHESDIPDDTPTELYGPHGLCPLLSVLDFRWCGYFKGPLWLIWYRVGSRTRTLTPRGRISPWCPHPSPKLLSSIVLLCKRGTSQTWLR